MASKLQILTEREGDTLILVPEGRIDSSNASEFEREMNDHIDNGDVHLVVDFSRLSFISSSGMRVLLIAAKRVRRGGKLVLCSMRDSIREIFSISGFDAIITVVKSRKDALSV